MAPDPALGSDVDARVVAGSVHGRAVEHARVTTRSPVAYDPYLRGRVVVRVTGTARMRDGDTVTWRAVLKHTTGAGLREARRELAVYRDGVAGRGPQDGLRAPALLAWAESEAHVDLWLEELSDQYSGQWPVARFGVAAGHVAAWDAAAGPVPPGFDSQDAWAERHGQPHRVQQAVEELEALGAAPAARELMGLLGDPGFRRTRALIRTTASRVSRLATFPQTLLHHDLVRSNLFALTPTSTAAIDWENVGRGPLGVNLAPLVVGSVRRGEASSTDLPELEDVVLSGYEAGLRRAGVADVSAFRAAYRLALGLRWHTVLGTIGAWLDPSSTRIRGSRPDEPRAESLAHLVALSRHLLAAGETAA